MTLAPEDLPTRIEDVEQLEDVLTTPDPALVADFARLDGDIMVLGVGGKMGPTLARLAKRAAPDKRIIGVARFSEEGLEDRLQQAGVETIRCDLLDRAAIEALPDAANIVFMAGRKFGTSGQQHLTWAMNVLMPALVAERFSRSRIVGFSTGCVYPYVPVHLAGGDRGHAAAGTARRVRQFLRRPRAHARAFFRTLSARQAASSA